MNSNSNVEMLELFLILILRFSENYVPKYVFYLILKFLEEGVEVEGIESRSRWTKHYSFVRGYLRVNELSHNSKELMKHIGKCSTAAAGGK